MEWVDGPSAIQQCDLVIYHGGFGTTMEVLKAGKPSIVIPSHSEQEGNGRRLEKLNVGRTLLVDNEELKTLDFSWPFGLYQMFAGFDINLDANNLLDSIEQLLNAQISIKLINISKLLNQLSESTDFDAVFKF